MTPKPADRIQAGLNDLFKIAIALINFASVFVQCEVDACHTYE
jgi:hypothetical protein